MRRGRKLQPGTNRPARRSENCKRGEQTRRVCSPGDPADPRPTEEAFLPAPPRSPGPSLVQQMNPAPVTAEPVRGLMGPPGQAPRGVWGRRGVAPGAQLLPRPKLMAQLGDSLLFLQEERSGEVG